MNPWLQCGESKLSSPVIEPLAGRCNALLDVRLEIDCDIRTEQLFLLRVAEDVVAVGLRWTSGGVAQRFVHGERMKDRSLFGAGSELRHFGGSEADR